MDRPGLVVALIFCIIWLIIIRINLTQLDEEQKLNEKDEKCEFVVDTLWVSENDTVNVTQLLKQQVIKVEYKPTIHSRLDSSKKCMLLYKYKSN